MAPAAATADAARRGDRAGVAAAPRGPLGGSAGGAGRRAGGSLWAPVEAAWESAPEGYRIFSPSLLVPVVAIFGSESRTLPGPRLR